MILEINNWTLAGNEWLLVLSWIAWALTSFKRRDRRFSLTPSKSFFTANKVIRFRNMLVLYLYHHFLTMETQFFSKISKFIKIPQGMFQNVYQFRFWALLLFMIRWTHKSLRKLLFEFATAECFNFFLFSIFQIIFPPTPLLQGLKEDLKKKNNNNNNNNNVHVHLIGYTRQIVVLLPPKFGRSLLS